MHRGASSSTDGCSPGGSSGWATLPIAISPARSATRSDDEWPGRIVARTGRSANHSVASATDSAAASRAYP